MPREAKTTEEAVAMLTATLRKSADENGEVWDPAAVRAAFCFLGAYARDSMEIRDGTAVASDCFCETGNMAEVHRDGAFRYDVKVVQFIAEALVEKGKRDGCYCKISELTPQEQRERDLYGYW